MEQKVHLLTTHGVVSATSPLEVELMSLDMEMCGFIEIELEICSISMNPSNPNVSDMIISNFKFANSNETIAKQQVCRVGAKVRKRFFIECNRMTILTFAGNRWPAEKNNPKVALFLSLLPLPPMYCCWDTGEAHLFLHSMCVQKKFAVSVAKQMQPHLFHAVFDVFLLMKPHVWIAAIHSQTGEMVCESCSVAEHCAKNTFVKVCVGQTIQYLLHVSSLKTPFSVRTQRCMLEQKTNVEEPGWLIIEKESRWTHERHHFVFSELSAADDATAQEWGHLVLFTSVDHVLKLGCIVSSNCVEYLFITPPYATQMTTFVLTPHQWNNQARSTCFEPFMLPEIAILNTPQTLQDMMGRMRQVDLSEMIQFAHIVHALTVRSHTVHIQFVENKVVLSSLYRSGALWIQH